MDQLSLFPSDDEAAKRAEASQRIEVKYAESLSKRGSNGRSYSPDYLATLPKNAIEALGITPKEQEEILFQYASTSSIPKTVALTRLPVDKVRAVVFNPPSADIIKVMRDRMRISIISKIEETQSVLLEAMQDEHKLSNASLREISNVFSEISSSQIALITANSEMNGPPELQVDPSEVFSGEELEYMALMRRKLSTAPRELRGSFEREDEYSGHDLVDVESVDTGISTEIDPGYEPIPTIVDRKYDPFGEDSSS